MTRNGTVAPFQSLEEDERSISVGGETKAKGLDMPKGNWTVSPYALAQLYVNGHEQMKQVIAKRR